MLILTRYSDAPSAASVPASSTRSYGMKVSHAQNMTLALFPTKEKWRKQLAKRRLKRQVGSVLEKIVVGELRKTRDAII